VADTKTYGVYDNAFIFGHFLRPPGERSIPQTQLLRDEAVKVWREYAALPDNLPY